MDEITTTVKSYTAADCWKEDWMTFVFSAKATKPGVEYRKDPFSRTYRLYNIQYKVKAELDK